MEDDLKITEEYLRDYVSAINLLSNDSGDYKYSIKVLESLWRKSNELKIEYQKQIKHMTTYSYEERKEMLLEFMQKDRFYGPTYLAIRVFERPTNESPSAFLEHTIKKMVKEGLLERNNKGRYRIKKQGARK